MPILQIASYEVVIDITAGPDAFWSRTEIRFGCSDPGADATADVHALNIRRAVLNGADLRDAAADGGLRLARLEGDNTLIVEAEFAYAAPGGVGLLREMRPDGAMCVYSRSHPGGAPHFFCCFDEPDLRAPISLSVNAPAGWSCIANAPLADRIPGQTTALWKFAGTRPVAPYLVNMCAGLSAGPTFACSHGDGSPFAVAAYALPATAERLDAELRVELFQEPLGYYERMLGVRYPEDKWDIAFVPQFTALAFGAPGLLTIRDEVLNAGGEPEIYLPIVFAHELTHAWFGGLIEIQPREDVWLEEGIATYVSRSATDAHYPDADLWSTGTSEALPDHAYSAYAAPLKHLETMIGQQAVMNGIGNLLRSHPDGTVTKDDLVRSWCLASGQDLREWSAQQLVRGS
jgi:aminopeptidase N